MVITNVMDPVRLIGYQLVFDPCAEECGGARTAYYYGLLLRQKLAKELENGAASVHGFLLLLDRVFLGDAKEKVGSSAKIAGRFSGKGGHGSHYRPPAAEATRHQERLMLGIPLRLLGHQFNGVGVVPVHARQNGPTRTTNKKKKKKDGWGSKTPSQTMRGVPDVGHSSCAQRVHSVVDVVRRAIEALFADVVRVGVLTPLNHLERALALPLCMGISRPPEMLRRVVHRSRAVGHLGLEAYGQKTLASWFERKRVLDPAWQHL